MKHLNQSKQLFEKLEPSLDAKREQLKPIFDKMDQRLEKMDEEEDTLMLDITDDMYCGSMSADMVADFTCMLCYGIVIEPIKCVTCGNLICKKCINVQKMNQGTLECYKKCGSKKFDKLSMTEQAIYDSLLFKCQNMECTCRIPLSMYVAHMRSQCPVQTYRHVKQPQGATNQFDNYGNEMAVDDDLDPFESDDDEFGSPFEFVIGDLNKMFLEEGEQLDPVISQLNTEELALLAQYKI